MDKNSKTNKSIRNMEDDFLDAAFGHPNKKVRECRREIIERRETEKKEKEEYEARRKQDREYLKQLAHESNDKIKQYKKDGLI